jgi:hypothetical protein
MQQQQQRPTSHLCWQVEAHEAAVGGRVMVEHHLERKQQRGDADRAVADVQVPAASTSTSTSTMSDMDTRVVSDYMRTSKHLHVLTHAGTGYHTKTVQSSAQSAPELLLLLLVYARSPSPYQ